MMNSIFDNRNENAGFRLETFQLYNWGTFHEHTVLVEPGGATSLLTGPNGSGKSTFVDAILTLLVPSKKRNYNLASGTERKSSRSPKTYVMGAYGNISDDQERTRVMYLRPKKENCFSVIIGTFLSEGLSQTISLAQAFWFSGEELNTIYVVANKPLHVKDHFQSGNNRELRRKLRKEPGVTLYDTFKEYAQDFSEQLGLQTSRALDLFNQTVAMKSIGNLNDFVRDHMLERLDMRDRIRELEKNYDNLNECHAQIIKAEDQQRLLLPLAEEAVKYEAYLLQRPRLKNWLRLLPAWIAEQKLSLYKSELETQSRKLEVAEGKYKQLNTHLKAAREHQAELEIAKRENRAFQRMKSLEDERRRVREALERTRIRAKAYNNHAAGLDLPEDPDRETFHQSFDTAESMRNELMVERGDLDAQITGIQKKMFPLEVEQNGLKEEIASLKLRRNLVPDTQVRLRKRICEALNIAESALPYVCELIRVKEEAYAWQGAIERVLHNFGLRLIVPARQYREITNYVNQTHLGARLQYHRVGTETSKSPAPAHKDDLFYKLDLKPQTPFKEWLGNQLLSHYDYRCTQDLETAGDARKALTKQGLIRSGKTLHEKDDRHDINDSSRFILGWDNKDKIAALEQRLEGLNTQLSVFQMEVDDLLAQKKTLEKMTEKTAMLLGFQDYEEIDWESHQARLNKLVQELKELEKASDQLQTIKRQLALKEVEIARLEKEKSGLDREIGSLTERKHTLKADYDQCTAILSELEASEVERYFPEIQGSASGQLIDSIERADDLLHILSKKYTDELDKIEEKLRLADGRMIRIMTNFLKDYPEKTTDLGSTMDYYPDFLKLLKRIEQEDLPRHKERFRKLLRKNIVNEISEFDNALRAKEEEIKQRIAKLNQSLALIAFNPNTRIRLDTQPVRDEEIRDFRGMLRNCIPDVGSDDPDENEKTFRNIKKLIDRFSAKEYERWTRKVTNVLQWLDFSVTEYVRETMQEIERYESSSGKSGGQIVKLAYTILGAAIAYQFGLEGNEVRSRSFRFVVIDEVFNNLDYRNAKYAMELFKKLDLQLMIVTPADKINVVSDYISTVNIVNRDEASNQSALVSMSYSDFDKHWKAEQERLKQGQMNPLS